MKLFQLANMIEAVGIFPNVSNYSICKSQWRICILPKLVWTCL